MSAREQMLARIRGALGREPDDRVLPAPPVRLAEPDASDRLAQFSAALGALGGTVTGANGIEDAKARVHAAIAGHSVVVSSAPLLGKLGLIANFSRDACARAEIGVTSADYALADTGTLVFLAGSGESRLISLIPPRHMAVIERAKILASLDELLSVVADPGDGSSAMVLVTGPSRTADIEMRLVRGVHGPGEITVIVV